MHHVVGRAGGIQLLLGQVGFELRKLVGLGTAVDILRLSSSAKGIRVICGESGVAVHLELVERCNDFLGKAVRLFAKIGLVVILWVGLDEFIESLYARIVGLNLSQLLHALLEFELCHHS